MSEPRPSLPPPIVPGLSGLTVLARGGYATVYRAIQESVSREVAVKVENRTMENERDQRRFLREARAAGRMSSHPHVVDLFDAGVTPAGHPFLIMELCDTSYADRMKNAPLSAAEVRDVGMKIADALADAHALGVLHRDVKPANLLVTRFGEPALADFGLAILAENRDASVTLDVLTPAYAPPELFRHHSPSPSVDVYALSATLYALMNGRPPRWQKDRNPSLLSLLELFNEPIPDLPGVPPALLSVLRLGMANEIEDRPSAEELRDLLAAVPPPAATRPSATAPVGASAGETTRPVNPDAFRATASVPIIIAPAHPLHPGPPHSAPPHSGPSQSGPAHPGPPPQSPSPPMQAAQPPQPPPDQPRWRRWLGFGAGAVVFVALLSTGIWYGVGRPGPTSTPSPLAQGSGLSPTVFADCLLATVTGAKCVDAAKPQCYGPLAVAEGVAQAETVPCEQTHTWEVFALAPLPAALKGAQFDAVAKDPAVAGICNVGNLAIVDTRTFDWRVTVLPPTTQEYDAGQHDFRCLAGKGDDGLTGPTLGRSN